MPFSQTRHNVEVSAGLNVHQLHKLVGELGIFAQAQLGSARLTAPLTAFAQDVGPRLLALQRVELCRSFSESKSTGLNAATLPFVWRTGNQAGTLKARCNEAGLALILDFHFTEACGQKQHAAALSSVRTHALVNVAASALSEARDQGHTASMALT